MKKFYYLIASIALISLFAGCKKDDPEITESAKFSVSIATDIDGLKASWDKGDSFTIYSENGKSTVAKTASGGAPAKFSADNVPSGKLYGIYPGDKATFSQGKFSFDIPSEQTYGGNNVILVGTGDKEGMTFSVPVAVIQVKLVGSCIVKDIAVNADKDIAGASVIDMNAGASAVATGSKTITLKDINLTMSGEEIFNIIAGAAGTTKLTVTLTDADANVKQVEINNADLSAGKAVIAQINHVAPLNLSSAATANCYVVAGAGDFKFAAKKVDGTLLEGDAVDYVWTTVENEYVTVPAAEGGTQTGIEISGAKGTMNPEWVVKNMSYDKTAGTISFTATGNKGNAVIALYKNTGSEKEIVWSWHIWSTGRSLEQMTMTNWQSKHLVTLGVSNSWLDMNVGALEGNDVNHVDSYGLMYQWGRKDPFPGFSKLGSKVTAFKEKAAFGEYTVPYLVNPAFGEKFAVVNTLVSKAEVVKFPLSYFNSSNYWCTDKENANWGDGYNKWTYKNTYHFLQDIDDTWNYTDGPRKADFEKDNDDPCPPGYRVPTIEQILHGFGFWGNVEPSQVDGETVTLADHWADTFTVEMSELTKSRIITSYADASKKMVYACSGYREASGVGNNLGKANYYPSATKKVDTVTYWRMICGDNLRMDASAGAYSIARNVRCVLAD